MNAKIRAANDCIGTNQTSPLDRVHVFSWRISMPPGELLVAGAVKPEGGKKAFA